jgi:hypothetical protein
VNPSAKLPHDGELRLRPHNILENYPMRLRIEQFRFLPDHKGIKVCSLTSTKELARIVPDLTYAGMWRVIRPDGSLPDMVNLPRAKDVAFGQAETVLYLRSAA